MGIVKGQVVLYTNKEKGDTSIQKARNRPAVVVSNNNCNVFSPVITIVPLTTKKISKVMPTHVLIDRPHGDKNIVLCEQILSVVKQDVIVTSEYVTDDELREIELGLMVQMGLIKHKPAKHLHLVKESNESPAENKQEICEESKPKETSSDEFLSMARDTIETNIKFLTELNKRIQDKNKK